MIILFFSLCDLSLQDPSSSIPLGAVTSSVIASVIHYLSVLPLRQCVGKILAGGRLRISQHAAGPRASGKDLAGFQDL